MENYYENVTHALLKGRTNLQTEQMFSFCPEARLDKDVVTIHLICPEFSGNTWKISLGE